VLVILLTPTHEVHPLIHQQAAGRILPSVYANNAKSPLFGTIPVI
jgi:hypothetical protein